MQLKLLVIRTDKLPEVVDFYTQLGFIFEYHRHEKGVFHYSTDISGTIFEIYPLLKSQKTPDISTRIGFSIFNFEEIINSIESQIFESTPIATEWGIMAVLKDPDGRKVEIYKA